MRILGVDPGTARVGWAIVDTRGSTVSVYAFGAIITQKEQTLPERLKVLHDDMTTLLHTHTPDCMAIEDLFFSTNVKTAIPVGQGRGVVLLAAAQRALPVYSYAPSTIKRAITGSGTADKKQIQKMVETILTYKTPHTLDDTVDAIAIALTHAYSYKAIHHI